jgi:hypothetical protein
MTNIANHVLLHMGDQMLNNQRLDLIHNVFYIHQLVEEGILNYHNHMQGIIIDLYFNHFLKIGVHFLSSP